MGTLPIIAGGFGLAGMTAMTMGMGQEQMQKAPENPIENQAVNDSVDL